MRRTVEHEAFVALAADAAGVRTPRFVALATAEPNAFVLAYEAIDGKSLDSVAPDDLTDAVLDAIWAQVKVLRAHRIAHRDLRLANVFLAADGEAWAIDFGFSELAASDLLLANDLAELTTSLASVVGVDSFGRPRRPRGRTRRARARARPAASVGAERRDPHRDQGATGLARRSARAGAADREPRLTVRPRSAKTGGITGDISRVRSYVRPA